MSDDKQGNWMDIKVGDKIKIGKEYSKTSGFKEGEIITLVNGYFEEDNGLYSYTSEAPSIYNEKLKDYDSIYHLFGNNLESFKDCEIINHDIENELKQALLNYAINYELEHHQDMANEKREFVIDRLDTELHCTVIFNEIIKDKK